jgi:hypothetical protein
VRRKPVDPSLDERLSAIEEAVRHLGRRLDEMQVSDPALKIALRAATITRSMRALKPQ